MCPIPIAILLLARDLLEPGGVLCVGVPNDFSPFQIAAARAAGAGEWWVAPPHHLNYFDFDSLSDLLARLGFDVVERTTSFPDGSVSADGRELYERSRAGPRLP